MTAALGSRYGKLLMPGDDPGGIIITILLGIAGAFVAKFIGQQLGWYSENEPAGLPGGGRRGHLASAAVSVAFWPPPSPALGLNGSRVRAGSAWCEVRPRHGAFPGRLDRVNFCL